MKPIQKTAALILVCISGLITQVQAQMTQMPADHFMVMPHDVKWVDASPSLPPGAKAAVIDGDPSKPGLFTLRLKIPAHYKVMPHWHPADEHITVLEGNCFMGVGDKMDEKSANELTTGGFGVMKAGTHHYFFSKKECIIQLHGIGPWGITYVNPADDPRTQSLKKSP